MQSGSASLRACLLNFARRLDYEILQARGGNRAFMTCVHTFAVKRLIAWYREGADVQSLLPLLSTYLGHVNLSGTRAYLTMTPELLAEASKRFARYAVVKEKDHDR